MMKSPLVEESSVIFWHLCLSLVALPVFLLCCTAAPGSGSLPLVINTWNVTPACLAAWKSVEDGSPPVDSVVAGCSVCEMDNRVCHMSSIGYGGSPDEDGETSLDAMVMDGESMDVGSVGCLRSVKNAIGVAHAVMKYTQHTLLVGELATDFALMMGFPKSSLETNSSTSQWHSWQQGHCQPNYRQNVVPDPTKICGPYKPGARPIKRSPRYSSYISEDNHDTIGMVVLDAQGRVASGTTTNGANHKVPGRVGDSPIAGAGSYAEQGIGGAAATGDGDVMMRFLPSLYAVQLMGQGVDPTAAAEKAIARISKHYPQHYSALIAVNVHGQYGAACHKFASFPYNVRSPSSGGVITHVIKCAP